nr:retrovirus-related Pol polyprotein from transposon TNT 1-94 [Tanacetum cinerariifolium]
MSVTACHDSLNVKTMNVNFVCATCGKCVLNEKHDMCVLKSVNSVNSRTKMPIVVPISTREPKRIVEKSVAKPLRTTVASETSNQKPRNITRKLYERVSKACSWWYPKFIPPGYKWKPKSGKTPVEKPKFKDTIYMGLWYPKDTGFELTAFSDSDHPGCLDSRKSTSGGIQFLGGDKLVSWSSKKQDCTSISFAEAETEYQLADLFTKALPEERFKYLVRRLGMRCLSPEELKVLANESA